jgi:hypothetical protein
MRSLGTRRVALFAGAAAVAAVALAGCSAGQVAETAQKRSSTYGVNVDNADGSVALRGVAVSYRSPKGYLSGGNAPLELSLFNQTTQPITVQVGSQPPAGADPKQGVVSARSVGIVGTATDSAAPAESAAPDSSAAADSSAAPDSAASDSSAAPDSAASAGPSGAAEPSQSPTPAKPDVQPAQVTIGPLDSVIFRPGDARTMQAIGLSGPLLPGNSVNLVFAFSNGAAPLVVQAPMAVPMSPAPRGSAEHEGVGEGEEGP